MSKLQSLKPYAGFIAALLFFASIPLGSLNLLLTLILKGRATQESLDWAIVYGSTFMGFWLSFGAVYWISTTVSRALSDQPPSILDRANNPVPDAVHKQYRLLRKQVRSNPEQFNEVKTVYRTYYRELFRWWQGYLLQQQLSVNWGRAFRMAYEQATHVVYITLLFIAIPYAVIAADPVAAVGGLLLGLGVTYLEQVIINDAILDLIYVQQPTTLPEPPINPPDIFMQNLQPPPRKSFKDVLRGLGLRHDRRSA